MKVVRRAEGSRARPKARHGSVAVAVAGRQTLRARVGLTPEEGCLRGLLWPDGADRLCLYPNKLQSQGQVTVYPTRPGQ